MNNTFRNQQGIISLTVVIFMMVIFVLILSLLESRILLGIERTRGVGDSFLSSYNAESEINDILAKVNSGKPFSLTKNQKRLSDGTVITTEGRVSGSDEIIDITAKLPYATTKLQITRKQTTSSTTYGQMDVLLALDCTGSMRECADDTKTNCDQPGSPNPTRLEVLKQAVAEFLGPTGLQSIASPPIRVGIGVFTADARWLKSVRDGRDITPNAGISYDDMLETINAPNMFNKKPSDSIACQNIYPSSVSDGGTSQATGLQFMHKFFNANDDGNTKQIEVLVSDGFPTSAIPDADCGLPYYVPNGPGDLTVCPNFVPSFDPSQIWECKNAPLGGYAYGSYDASYSSYTNARRSFSCFLADSSTKWEGNTVGKRKPNVDSHVVVTFKLDENDPIKKDYPQYPGVKIYDMDDATSLAQTLKDQVLGEIKSTAKETQIRRVIP